MRKQTSNATLRLAVLAASVVGTGGFAASALAQQAATPQAQEATIEEVVVTGTRIRSPGLVANSPISSVDQVELNFRQPTSAEDFIKQLPAAVPALGSGTNNGSPGASTVNLRGLGSNRNLLLLNGRRIVPFSLGGSVDTNFVPVAMLERADLVTGGASAVYGADAVSGVINFVLRRDFEGVELNTFFGTSEEGDAETTRTDLTIGANTSDGRGNVTLSFGYTDQNPLLQGDRPLGEVSLSSATGAASGSSAGVPSFSVLPLGTDPDTGEPTAALAQFDPGLGRFRTDNLELFNFNPLNHYQGALKRTQATFMGHYEVAPVAEVYGEFIFMDNTRKAQLAPSGSFFNNYNVTVSNPFLTDEARQQICAVPDAAGNPQIDPANCTADNTDTVLMQLRRRFVELGPRLNDFDNQIFQYTAGVRGDLSEIAPNWGYDVYFSRGEATQNQVRGNWGSLSKVQQALQATTDPDTGEPVCLDPSGGCVPLNLLGPAGSITDEMIDFINLDAFLGQQVKQDVFSASLSGDLGDFRSPWAQDNPIGVALGYERRKVTASTSSDAASQIDSEVLGTGAPTPDRTGAFKLNEFYVEALAPILPTVVLEAGYRYSDFSLSGGGSSDSYGTWKVGGAWDAMDGLRFRAMFQRATRSPNVNELFAPQVTGLSNLDTDPCQGNLINSGDANTAGTLSNLCRQTGVPLGAIGGLPAPAAGQINQLTGGNLELGQEEADTYTIGFVYQPEFARDLTVTLDYFRIEMSDMVSSPSTTDILDQCFDPALNPNFSFNQACALVGRSPTTGDLNAGDALGVVTASSNLGEAKTDGIDLGIVYGVNLTDWGFADRTGSLTFAFNMTHVLDWKFQATPASVNRDCVGFFSIACNSATSSGMIHENKFNLRSTWSVQDFDLSLNWRRLSKMKLEPGAGNFLDEFSSISATNYLDFAGAWSWNDTVRINLTINNLLDKSAPNVGNTIGGTAVNSGNTFPQFYDVIGRFYTVGLNVRF